MKTLWRRLVCAMVAATLVCVLLTGAPAVAVERLSPAVAAQASLDALFEQYQTLGACVCVIENGVVAYTLCYGTVSPDGEPVTEDTLFRVGSISKMVTAMGVMQLVENGIAELDGDLTDMLGFSVQNPRYPDDSVTLRQVLCHTATLRDGGFYRQALQGQVTPLDELFSEDAKYSFYTGIRPGSRYQYSNFGGGLLGSLLESLTGQTVDAYMEEHIFAPLGVTAAYQGALLPEDRTVSNQYSMPSGQLTEDVRGTAEAVTDVDPLRDYVWTAGKLTLSAPDMAKLLMVLCDDGVYGDTRILTDGTVSMMRTPQNNIGSVSVDSDWGLGVCILADGTVEGRTLYGHGGKASGMLCAAYCDPTDRTGVVMLTNGCNNAGDIDGVGKLSVLTIRLCYETLIDGLHTTQSPYLVAGD